jgi:hypothetical protein
MVNNLRSGPTMTKKGTSGHAKVLDNAGMRGPYRHGMQAMEKGCPVVMLL